MPLNQQLLPLFLCAISYLQDSKVIAKIMEAQGLPQFRAPPPLLQHQSAQEDFECSSY